MAMFGLILIIFGIGGLTLATFAIPMIAALFARRGGSAALIHSSHNPPVLSIWVAAHNEEKVIQSTLESILSAIEYAKSHGAHFHFELGVALDHCADGTLDQVELFEKRTQSAVRVLENPGVGAKWWNLKNIVSQVDSDWTAFVDAGSLWDSKLILRAIEEMKEGVVAIAPSYSAKNSGLMERMNWKLESYLKKFENRAGGPVSVHGASVFYKTDALKNAFNHLGADLWLNDDVAIPLSIRLHLTSSKIVYLADHPTGWVSDMGVRGELDLEYRRRRRMVYGNIQWIQKLLLTTRGLSSPMAFFLSLRRVFRLFWAYWVLFLGLGICAMSPVLGLVLFVVGLAGLAGSSFLRRVGMAFWSGLQVPQLWSEFFLSKRGVQWN